MKPLADRIRPVGLDDVFGQEHLTGENKILRRIIDSGNLTNMIFYGPPGTGKTTVANIAAKVTDRAFYKLNATNASVKDIKDIIDDMNTLMTRNGILLYLDEIQNFNKKQQQSLLEFIENGSITLIASTTENPFFYIYKAILSRSTVFEFKPLESPAIVKGIKRGFTILMEDYKDKKLSTEERIYEYIADISSGDMRRALNITELIFLSNNFTGTDEIIVTEDMVREAAQTKLQNHDRDGDSHYDLLSAFQKSIRGSDPDAAVHYLAKLINSGDLQSICRRLLVIAAEDIGLAYPMAITIVKSCVDSALQIGLPEGRIPLAEATVLLATSPKSNTAHTALEAALSDVQQGDTGDIPPHIKDAHYSGAEKLGRGIGYKYPHSYENNYVSQQYLPDRIKDKVYYKPGNNKFEKSIEEHFKRLKGVK